VNHLNSGRRRALACVGSVLLLAAGLAPASLFAQSKEETIRIAYNLPKDHATGLYFETLAQEIERNTANASIHIKARTFPNGQIYNDTQLADAVSTGVLNIGQMNPGFINSPDVEALRFWGVPFTFGSWEALWYAEDNPVYRGIFEAQFNKLGMHLLGWAAYGTVEFYASKPIKLPSDIKGLRLRAFGVDTSMLIRDLGGSPVSMSSQEMYQAVQRGTIDGFITGPTSVHSRKLYEVAKHGTSVGIQYLSFPATVSLKWWTGLPQDVKTAIEKASVTAQQKSRARAKEDDRHADDQLAKLGVSLPKLTAAEHAQWVTAAKKRSEEFVQKSGENGRKLIAVAQEANAKFSAKR